MALPATLPLAAIGVVSLVLFNALAVNAVTGERDGLALDLLLVTDLRPREFVFGKLLGVLYVGKGMILLPMALLLFLAVVLLPLVYRQGWKQPLLGSFLAIGIPSLFIEQTWETQLGVAFYLTFLLMAIRFYDHTDAPLVTGNNPLQKQAVIPPKS